MAIFDRSIDVNNFSGLLRNCLKKMEEDECLPVGILEEYNNSNFRQMLHIHTIVYNMLSTSLPCEEMAKNSTAHFLIVSKDLNVCFQD